MVKHPHRYPNHEDDKGTTFAGECNTTACKNTHAIYYNAATFGYYCLGCARGINGFRKADQPLCMEVEGPLTITEMDERYKKVIF